MEFAPLSHKFYNLSDASFATSFFFVIVLGFTGLGIVVVLVVRVVGVFDHENVKSQVVTGDREWLHVQIVIRELHITISFWVINFEYFLVRLRYALE